MAEIGVTSSADKRGEDALLALVFPETYEEMSDTQKTEFNLAAAEQLAFMDSPAREVKSESLGDVRITYSGNGGNMPYSCGIMICPAAYARLMRCGLLTRWV